MSDVQHVRQLLANELGVTREMVQQEIAKRIEKLLGTVDVEAIVARVAERILNEAVKKPVYDYTSMRSLVSKVAEKVIAEKLVMSMKP